MAVTTLQWCGEGACEQREQDCSSRHRLARPAADPEVQAILRDYRYEPRTHPACRTPLRPDAVFVPHLARAGACLHQGADERERTCTGATESTSVRAFSLGCAESPTRGSHSAGCRCRCHTGSVRRGSPLRGSTRTAVPIRVRRQTGAVRTSSLTPRVGRAHSEALNPPLRRGAHGLVELGTARQVLGQGSRARRRRWGGSPVSQRL